MINHHLLARLDISQWHLPWPVLSILGPIVGLIYVIVLPMLGFVTLVFLCLGYLKAGLAATWRKAFRTTIA